MLRRGLAFLRRQIDWTAIVGSAIATPLLFLIFFTLQNYGPGPYPNNKSGQWNIPWDWLSSSAAWTAIFTGVLTWSTLRLWRETRRLAEGADVQAQDMKASIAAASAMATAAQKSADTAEKALTVLERPYVFVKGIQFDGAVTASITFQNYGRTPANIAMVSVYLRILDRIPRGGDEIYAGPEAAKVQEPINLEAVIGEGAPWTPPNTMCINGPTPEQYQDVRVGIMHYYLWGEVIYRDVFGNEHPTVFCRKFDWHAAVWEPVGGMDRNYGR